jgi:hypothetical protein
VAQPSITCDAGSVTLTVTNAQQNVSYTWKIGTQTIGFGTSITYQVSADTEFTVIAGVSACSKSSNRSVYVTRTSLSPAELSRSYHKVLLTGTGTGGGGTHYWQNSAFGTDKSADLLSPFTVTQNGNYYIRQFYSTQNCWTIATGPFNVNVDVVPPQATITQVPKPGYNELHFMNTDKDHILQFADYYFVTSATGTEQTKLFHDKQKILVPGTYFLRGKDKQTNTWGPTATFTVAFANDKYLNWIATRAYDGTLQNGEPVTVAESKSYFDDAGQGLQSQSKSLQTHTIFVTQSLRDRYDRVTGSTLAAPKTGDDFNFISHFLTNPEGGEYTYANYDDLANGKMMNPDPIGSDEGTLGWYYSESNTLEPLTPKTHYPYSRSEYYEDGTGEMKRSAGPGDQHRLGQGHEVLTGTFPVFLELSDYLAKRLIAIPNIVQDGSLFNEGVQKVVRDENGKYAISITDKEGKTVLSARPGTAADHILDVQNVVTSKGCDQGDNCRRMTYFYVLQKQPVTITGSTDFIVENIVSGERLPAGQTFANPNDNNYWPAGFYRVLLTNPSSQVEIRYTNYYTDVSYQFYDDAGRLRASVSPNGVQQWKKGGIPYGSIDKTTYKYNFRGWLLEMNEPDAGRTRYVYRKDGNIRFSQNAQQKIDKRFSYTHYDKLGRPVESGEYKGSDAVLPFVSMDSAAFAGSAMNGLLEKTAAEIAWDPAVRKDWMRTCYDDQATLIPNMPEGLSQKFVRGAVSWTENANIQTWYSYDELGRVVWMAQKPRLLNKTFVTQYTYDFTGNVLTVHNAAYITGAPTDQFYHHYTYDKDKRLSKAYTSTDGTNKKLRATYEYYLHGPLKRIVLGDQLQGIDFVYNIQGWLTQINHPDVTQDPGKDGNDVFGMVLDYYESTLSLAPVTGTFGPSNLHGLPEGNHSLLAGHQPLPRFTSFVNEPSSATSVSPFKSYSAESPRYKEMLKSNK